MTVHCCLALRESCAAFAKPKATSVDPKIKVRRSTQGTLTVCSRPGCKPCTIAADRRVYSPEPNAKSARKSRHFPRCCQLALRHVHIASRPRKTTAFASSLSRVGPLSGHKALTDCAGSIFEIAGFGSSQYRKFGIRERHSSRIPWRGLTVTAQGSPARGRTLGLSRRLCANPVRVAPDCNGQTSGTLPGFVRCGAYDPGFAGMRRRTLGFGSATPPGYCRRPAPTRDGNCCRPSETTS